MTKIEQHKKMCDDLHDLYVQKNTAYGDSFGETYKKLGIISAVTRISDKYNRLVNLATHRDVNCGDESLRDTLVDLSNYAIMTAMEIDNEKVTDEDTPWKTPTSDDLAVFINKYGTIKVPTAPLVDVYPGSITAGLNPDLSTIPTSGLKYTE